jgi:Right handed beta helix region
MKNISVICFVVVISITGVLCGCSQNSSGPDIEPINVLAVLPDSSGEYPNIQAAVNAAAEGDIVELADGLYRGEGNYNINLTGRPVTIRAMSNTPENCVVDCEGQEGQLRRGFLFVDGGSADVLIEGITIRNGSVPDGADPDSNSGGAIFCVGSSFTMRNCHLTDNHAAGQGGAIYVAPGNTEQTIDVLFDNCVIQRNSALTGGAGYLAAGDVAFESCGLFRNWSRLSGGGIYSESDELLLRKTYMAENRAYIGSGIYTRNSNLQVVDCMIVNNGAHYPASGAYEGGGLFVSNSDCKLINSVIAFNATCRSSANYGGACIQYCPTLEITNCTFYKNTVDATSSMGIIGGLLVKISHSHPESQFNMKNTIIAQSLTGYGFCLTAPTEHVPNVECCDSFGNADGDEYPEMSGCFNEDPLFEDPDNGNFNLLPSSPCLASASDCGFIGTDMSRIPWSLRPPEFY